MGYSMVGCQRAMMANRLSFFFDFKGGCTHSSSGPRTGAGWGRTAAETLPDSDLPPPRRACRGEVLVS